jgi:hypothetical protein
VLGRYVGAYQMAPGVNMVITLDDHQLLSKLGAQAPIPIFPESETMFFPKVVDAELEFSKEGTQLTLHQSGRDMPAKRLDDAESKRLVDAAVANAKRIKDQTAAPGNEAMVRTAMEQLRSGKLDYDRMSPGLASATRSNCQASS